MNDYNSFVLDLDFNDILWFLTLILEILNVLNISIWDLKDKKR